MTKAASKAPPPKAMRKAKTRWRGLQNKEVIEPKGMEQALIIPARKAFPTIISDTAL
jgi:hypothetical protein